MVCDEWVQSIPADRADIIAFLAAEAPVRAMNTIERRLYATLLRKSADGRTSPIPGETYPTALVTGMPSAV